MAEDKPTFIERLRKVVRSRVAAGTLGTAIGLGSMIGDQSPKVNTSSDVPPNPTPAFIKEQSPEMPKLSFTKFLDMSLDERKKELENLVGKDVVLEIDQEGVRSLGPSAAYISQEDGKKI